MKLLVLYAATFLVVFTFVQICNSLDALGVLSGGAHPPTAVTIGAAFRYNSLYPPQTVNGDGWATAWADDDKLYTFHNDGSLWNNTGVTGNVMMDTLSDYTPSVVGTLVNQMTAWGASMATETGSPIKKSHKVMGAISISGTIYGLGWRLCDIDPGCTNATGITDGQLLKTTDHGATITPVPPATALPYVSPMFPGNILPFSFVQYGKDYTGNGPDNSSTYVYATVFDGTSIISCGSCASRALLARVPIASIANQNAADWSYYVSGDGMSDANWTSSVSGAGPIFTASDSTGGRAGMLGMQYLPYYGIYLTVTGQNQPAGPSSTKWFFYICNHPWGPCRQIGPDFVWNPQGYGMADVIPKSLGNGGKTFVVATSGNYTNQGDTGLYTLTYLPVTLSP